MKKIKILFFYSILYIASLNSMDHDPLTYMDEIIAFLNGNEDRSQVPPSDIKKTLHRTYTYDLIHALYSDLPLDFKKRIYKDILKCVKNKTLKTKEDIYYYLSYYTNGFYDYLGLPQIAMDGLDEKALVDANSEGCFMSYGTFKALKLRGIYTCPTTRRIINIGEPIFIRNLIGYMRKIKNRHKIDLDEFITIDPVTNETLYTNLESAKRIIGLYTKSTNPKLLENSCAPDDPRFVSIKRLIELLDKKIKPS